MSFNEIILFLFLITILLWWIPYRITNYVFQVGKNTQGYANEFASRGNWPSSQYWQSLELKKNLINLFMVFIDPIFSLVNTILGLMPNSNQFITMTLILNIFGIVLPVISFIISCLFLRKFHQSTLDKKYYKSFLSIINPLQAADEWINMISKCKNPDTK